MNIKTDTQKEISVHFDRAFHSSPVKSEVLIKSYFCNGLNEVHISTINFSQPKHCVFQLVMTKHFVARWVGVSF